MSGGFRSRSSKKPTGGSGERGSQRDARGRRLTDAHGGGSRSGQARGKDRGSKGGKIARGNSNGKARGGAPRQGVNLRADAERFGVDLPRVIAFDTLIRVEQDEAFANLILPKALRVHSIEGRDAAFATELAYGALRAEGVLDAVISRCSSRELSTLDQRVLCALRLGAYQLLYTRVEAHAAVDTTVRLVEMSGQEKAKGFANAVMRAITRTPVETWFSKLSPEGEVAALAFKHAHPEWIAHSFSRVVGLSELEAALAGDSARPTVHLVARPGEISAEELALMTGFEQGKYSPYAVYMDSGDPGQLEPVRDGLAGVQDEGSQLIARALTEVPLDGADSGRWLDLCAGPGGKAALLGALARIDGATVDAVEVAPHRAELISKLVRDLPVTVHVADGRNPGLKAGYDRILVDAPCSGLGALRRRPEARWRKREEDIAELAPLQFELLESAVKLVRAGGVVVYSTCSPDLRETRSVVDRAVKELGVVELDARRFLPEMPDLGNELSAQMWPHRHGTDAMFFAVLSKPAS